MKKILVLAFVVLLLTALAFKPIAINAQSTANQDVTNPINQNNSGFSVW